MRENTPIRPRQSHGRDVDDTGKKGGKPEKRESKPEKRESSASRIMRARAKKQGKTIKKPG
jgi:hypothetical protein